MKARIFLCLAFLGASFQSLSQDSSHSALYIYRFIFPENSADLNEEQVNKLDELTDFIRYNPKIVLNISPFLSVAVGEELGVNRFQSIQRCFINSGFNFLHFELVFKNLDEFPHSPETSEDDFFYNANEVTFQVADYRVSPCDSISYGPVIHFPKDSMEIFETECDSLADIFRIMMENDSSVFQVIGIAKSRDDQDRLIAMDRAELVMDKLIEMGVPEERLEMYMDLYYEPKDGEHRDWPYYPLWYEYEIGVHFQMTP